MEWVKVFNSKAEAEQQLPMNEVVQVMIGNYDICLGHTQDGFFAIDDTCPHEAASLGMGKCFSGGIVECPWHHYRFDLKTGKNIGNTSYDVGTYPVKIDESGVYIGIEN